MKKAFKVITLLMLVILVVTAFAMPASAKQVFTDLSPEHWCYAKIMDFEKKGYVCGYSDNTFRADRTITRAEYVKIVNNFFGYKPSEKTTSAFKDVNSGDWFMPYVNEAVDRGYIEGFEDGTFRPQDPIRRQEATVILARILKIDKEVYPADHKDGLAQYSDSDEVQEWARVAIHSYSVYNFINGYEDGTLRILRNVTRAETVELLHILEQKVVIDRKPGGGGTKTPTLKPDIDVLVRNLIEVPVENEIAIKEEYTPAIYTKSNWINKKNSNFEKETARNGAFVNITSQTTGSTIHDTVDVISRKEEYKTTKRDEYDNKFFLTDGVYTVTAKATKSGRKDSSTAEREVKIDTVAPIAYGVATTKSGEISHEQSITVSVKDLNLYKTNEISGLDKVAYAWFNADTEERVTSWVALSLVNGQAKVDAPVAYGSYKLGISAIDVAENTFGTKTEFNVKAEDISGDVPTNPSGDVDYDFVKEIESGEETPSGDDIVVIVGNNPPTIEDLILYTSVNELVSGELIGKDIDSGDVLSYELKDEPNYGTANVTGNETTYVSDKTGTYTYTVRVKDNNSGEAIGNVTVYVYDAEVEIPENPSGDEIKYPDLSGDKLIIFTGEEKDMTVTVAPSGEPIKDIKYNWSFKANEEKAKISSGADEEKVTVKGLIPGETKITVKVKVNIEKSNGETETVEIKKEITVVVLSRITIQIPSDSKTYDGTPLKAKNFEVVSGSKALIEGVMASGDQITVGVSGERIDVGSSDAVLESYTILNRNSEDVAKYYVPTFKDGTLTIIAKADEIVIKAISDSKKYDGTVLKNSGYTYTSGVLVSGDILEAVVSGEQLNAGSGDNKVISYKVTRNGVDVTDNYTFGECVDGVLEVTKRKVTLTSASASKVYDGRELTSGDVTVTGDGFVSGEGATYDVTGTITNVGEAKNEFTYTLKDNTSGDNYEITTNTGILKVTPVTEEVVIKVKGNSASGDKYDGNEKKVTGYEVVSITNDNGLYSSDDVSYSGEAIAKGTNAGTYKMGLSRDKFINTNENFANVIFVLEEDGKLEIAKREVTLTSATDSKVYDGTALTNKKVLASGDGFVKGEGATYDVTGTITNVGSVENSFTYTLNEGTLADNYNITKVEGTLKITEKIPSVTISVTPDYPNNGKEAEPGDTISYDAEIKNNESYNINVKIDIDSDSDFAETIDTIKVYDKDGNKIEEVTSIDETITILAGGTVKVTYKSEVSSTHPINTDFNSTVKVSTETGKKISSITVNNDIEKSVGVFDATHKDKNVILILDLSGSMDDKTKDGKTTKIKALRTATQQFVDKLYNSSKETNTKVTLNVIGIGEAHDVYYGVWPLGHSYDSPSKRNNKDKPILFDSRYGDTDAYLIDSYINTNQNTWIASDFIENRLNADGGTNIVGALKLANGIMDGTYTSKNGISNFITNADNYVVILTDGANGLKYDNWGNIENKPISKDKDGLKYSKSLRESGAGIYAVYFEGNNADENDIGKADLNTILNNEYPLYGASSADSLNMAFDSIASSISKTQSKGGEITATLPSGDKYLIIVTCKENNEEKTLITVNEILDLEKYGMEIRGNKLIWNISGTKYSACEDLKLKVTLDNTATDGKSTENTLELLPIESGEKTVIVSVVDEKEDITSGDVDTSEENETTVSGDTEIQNNDEAKSVSGEDKVFNTKDVELDNNKNEQQNEEKNQEENVDGKEENKEVDNENQVNEVEGKQNEKVDNQKEEKEESEKETKEEPKLEEDNNEEKKEPMILEEKRDDDDSNDTSDSDKKIE